MIKIQVLVLYKEEIIRKYSEFVLEGFRGFGVKENYYGLEYQRDFI